MKCSASCLLHMVTMRPLGSSAGLNRPSPQGCEAVPAGTTQHDETGSRASRGPGGSGQLRCQPTVPYPLPGWDPSTCCLYQPKLRAGPGLGDGVCRTSCPSRTSYLFLSSVHCWPWSSSLQSRRQRPWAGSPEAVSSTCVVRGLLTGLMPLSWATRRGRDECVGPSCDHTILRVNSLAESLTVPLGKGGLELTISMRGCGVSTLKYSL